MNLCIIARADLTGLGVQSRNWVRLLKPYKIIVINSRLFNNNEQHFEWYNPRNSFRVDGFIKPHEIKPILHDVHALLTFEIPYSYELLRVAKQDNVKTIIQNNWEFTDYLKQPHLPLPDLLVNHSYWHLKDQRKLFPDITDYCPTPIFIEDYDEIMLQNMDRPLKKRRFLHVAGRRTYEDRNGTDDLLAAMKFVPRSCDFELVIKTQDPELWQTKDHRITIDRSHPVDEKELYRGFDTMIIPRRYGGASLPMNEALTAGMPVVMTDIEPNNQILPKEWLVYSKYSGTFTTRTPIEVFSAERNALADKIIEFATKDENELLADKIRAREIAVKEYSSEVVLEKWTGLIRKLGL